MPLEEQPERATMRAFLSAMMVVGERMALRIRGRFITTDLTRRIREIHMEIEHAVFSAGLAAEGGVGGVLQGEQVAAFR